MRSLNRISFNSLQTGTRIQRHPRDDGASIYHVSIPFKREGGSKGTCENRNDDGTVCVSIPFKRERISKATLTTYGTGPWAAQFPFPSNGKVDRKFIEADISGMDRSYPFPFPSNGKTEHKHDRLHCQLGERHHVSIPFKRERASQGAGTYPPPTRGRGGVSIPFKRERASQVRAETVLSLILPKFPFPSNRKAHRKAENVGRLQCESIEVSIPFKPESTSQVRISLMLIGIGHRFHSLQTGTRSTSDDL